MQTEVAEILKINQERLDEVHAPFNPITGKGSVGSRFECVIEDFPIKRQWLPDSMRKIPLVRKLMAAGSLEAFLCDTLGMDYDDEDIFESDR